jgi:hypothetical protein
MKPFTDIQPKRGDVALMCLHLPREWGPSEGSPGQPGGHWYRADTNFTTPTGETGTAQWFLVCQTCHRKWNRRGVEFPIDHHIVVDWDDPTVVIDK